MTKSKVNSKVTKKVNTKKVAKKVIKKVRKKKVVTLSTKPKNRVLMKGDNNYPQSKSEQVRCDNLAYLMKEIMEKIGEKKLPLRNFRVSGQFYGKRYFKNFEPKPKVKTFIQNVVKDIDVGGLI